MSRSTTAKMAAAKYKKRPPSALHPNSRRTRNADPRGLAFMAWVKQFPCVVCYRYGWRRFLSGESLQGIFPAFDSNPYFSLYMHIGGTSAAKSPNWHGLPGCEQHHDSGNPYCEHKLKKRFGPHWGIDIEALIVKLNEEFDRLYPPGTKGLLVEGLDGG